ncbi:MAG: hypothetical protein ACOVK2_05805 [Candidatus Fonsibacter sp.]|jgi:hypothetical protein
MGQYGNQPDFGTRALTIVPTGDQPNGTPGQNLNSAALYIGTGGDLVVSVVGGDGNSGYSGITIFKNIPDGTFFPVIVNNVWATYDSDILVTTCSNIVALY